MIPRRVRRTGLAAFALGLGIAAAAQLAAPLATPPLYDGVVVVQPYVYVNPPAGKPGGVSRLSSTTAFGATEKAGVYTVARGASAEDYAVNLLDKNESSIAPAETLTIGRAEIQGEKGQIEQDREMWRWFLVAARAVLVVEWWIFSRRAWIW